MIAELGQQPDAILAAQLLQQVGKLGRMQAFDQAVGVRAAAFFERRVDGADELGVDAMEPVAGLRPGVDLQLGFGVGH